MRLMDVPRHAHQLVIQTLPRQIMIDEAALDAFLDTAPHMTAKYTKKWIKDALAIAAYHAQRDPPFPVVPLLIGDDAPQWAMLTEELALCWVHDGRAYKRLEPRLDYHRQLRDQILAAYWALYHDLRRYQQHPTSADAAHLRAAFDTFVDQRTGYAALDARLAITAEKRRGLLMVLEHPEIPLHNNPAELGARRRVRKRDVSFGARTSKGAALWDSGHTLAATAQQLDVNIHHYVVGRLCGDPHVTPLATCIRERAAGSHWADHGRGDRSGRRGSRLRCPCGMPESFPRLLSRYHFRSFTTYSPSWLRTRGPVGAPQGPSVGVAITVLVGTVAVLVTSKPPFLGAV